MWPCLYESIHHLVKWSPSNSVLQTLYQAYQPNEPGSFKMLRAFNPVQTCVGIHSGRVEPASPIALTTSQTEALQAQWSCASSLDTLTQTFTRGPEIGSRSSLVVVAHVFSWPSTLLRQVRGGVGRRRSLASSPTQRNLLCTSIAGMFVRGRRRRSSKDGTQSLRLMRRMRWMLSLSRTSNILSSATRTFHVSLMLSERFLFTFWVENRWSFTF